MTFCGQYQFTLSAQINLVALQSRDVAVERVRQGNVDGLDLMCEIRTSPVIAPRCQLSCCHLYHSGLRCRHATLRLCYLAPWSKGRECQQRPRHGLYRAGNWLNDFEHDIGQRQYDTQRDLITRLYERCGDRLVSHKRKDILCLPSRRLKVLYP